MKHLALLVLRAHGFGPDRLAAACGDEFHRHVRVYRVDDRPHHLAAEVPLSEHDVGTLPTRERAVVGVHDLAAPLFGRGVEGRVSEDVGLLQVGRVPGDHDPALTRSRVLVGCPRRVYPDDDAAQVGSAGDAQGFDQRQRPQGAQRLVEELTFELLAAKPSALVPLVERLDSRLVKVPDVVDRPHVRHRTARIFEKLPNERVGLLGRSGRNHFRRRESHGVHQRLVPGGLPVFPQTYLVAPRAAQVLTLDAEGSVVCSVAVDARSPRKREHSHRAIPFPGVVQPAQCPQQS